jgi:hypothetical protein
VPLLTTADSSVVGAQAIHFPAKKSLAISRSFFDFPINEACYLLPKRTSPFPSNLCVHRGLANFAVKKIPGLGVMSHS